MNIQNPSALARIRTRMGLIIRRLQPLRRQVRVHLGGAQRLVSQQLLHAAQVCAVLKQVRREAVPQRVRLILGSWPDSLRYLTSLRRTERLLMRPPCLFNNRGLVVTSAAHWPAKRTSPRTISTERFTAAMAWLPSGTMPCWAKNLGGDCPY